MYKEFGIKEEVISLAEKINKDLLPIFDEIDKRFDKVDKKFIDFNDKMNEGFSRMDKGFAEVNNKLDILTNSNMAQILMSQNQSTKEMNEKLDKYITQNEIEHKKFDYEIAETKMKLKFAR